MKLGVLFSGGKDSCFSCFLAREYGYEISCLISIVSENPYSYMFHTPSIGSTRKQAEAMGVPLISRKTKGLKELELADLEKAIRSAREEHHIGGILTGAVESVYQSTRIQKICDRLDMECFNPLWQRDQTELLKEMVKNRFRVIITGVFAYPFDDKWLGRRIDAGFIEDARKLKDRYQINPAGEGGEFETFVLDCPLFDKPLKPKGKKVSGSRNSWRMELML